MHENDIIIKQDYFTDIESAINSINDFFSTGFKTRNFPVLDDTTTLEPTIEKIVTRLSSVDPTWLSDESKFNDIITMINEGIANIDPVDGIYDTIINTNNTTLIEAIEAYIGFKELQLIADNFESFGKFVNGIYTFDLFMKPSQFVDVLQIFSQPIPHDEIPDLDIDEPIYSDASFVEGIINSTVIDIPEALTNESETERMAARQDLQGYTIMVDDTVQEAAEVNYFENFKPPHMKYAEGKKKWAVSKQYQKVVDDLISGLRACDSTDDLKAFFEKNSGIAEKITAVVCPFVLAKVFKNKNKYTGAVGNLEDYTKSYDSIVKNNNGAKRFENYDIFTTFKTDKDGTIKFIEDFLKLNLVNDPGASIENHTLLTIFNIFDSRIYYDILFYAAPESVQTEYHGEDAFVKTIRGRVNKNSRNTTAYTNSDELTSSDSTTAADGTENTVPETKPETTETVTEYVSRELEKFGDMSISDMMYCEHYSDIIEAEIETIDDRAYNAGISPFTLEAYIGEDLNNSYGVDEYIMEAKVTKRRETFQQGVCALMDNMEEIVKLDKKHMWNANTLGSRYKQTFNPIYFLIGSIAATAMLGVQAGAAAAGVAAASVPLSTSVSLSPSGSPIGSSEQHSNIKAVHHSTGAALRGKLGRFTPQERQTIKRLHNLTTQLWVSVKRFWMNPRNWLKEINIAKNTKKQFRTEVIADIAKQIVDMKDELSFIIDNDNFVNEAFYDGSPDYVFQEATTEKNNQRFQTAMNLMLRDMKLVKGLVDKKQWTNAKCAEMFHAGIRKSEAFINVCQAIKYATRAFDGAAGVSKDNKDFLENLISKLQDIRKITKIKSMSLAENNINANKKTVKIGNLAGEIVEMAPSIEAIIKAGIVKDKPKAAELSSAENNDTPTTESAIMGIDEFILVMEQEDGSIPAYMRDRLKMSDDLSTTVTPAQLPEGVPTNPIGDITASIDTKVENGGDDLGSTLGSGFDESKLTKGEKDRIVINVTNNYTNSFNQNSNNTSTKNVTSNDSSTGKTVNNSNTNSNNTTNSGNDSSSNKRTDNSSNKKNSKSSSVHKNSNQNSDRSFHTSTSGSNNNNNSNDSVDTKDSPSTKDGEQKLSNGKTIQEMFMFLESTEPRSSGNNAGNPPKQDLLTHAMDVDRKTLATQKSAEKGVQKVANTGKAVLKPIERTKSWITKQVNSLIKRDEDKVKAELLENKSYRSAIFKANRLALKLGLIGVCFTIQPYLGAIALGVSALRTADKHRIKLELRDEIATELEIIEDKIEYLKKQNDPASQKQAYEYTRMQQKLKRMFIEAPKQNIKHPRSVV